VLCGYGRGWLGGLLCGGGGGGGGEEGGKREWGDAGKKPPRRPRFSRFEASPLAARARPLHIATLATLGKERDCLQSKRTGTYYRSCNVIDI